MGQVCTLEGSAEEQFWQQVNIFHFPFHFCLLFFVPICEIKELMKNKSTFAMNQQWTQDFCLLACGSLYEKRSEKECSNSLS